MRINHAVQIFARIYRQFLNHGLGRALRHRDFTLYVFAGWISNMGIWFQRVGFQWLTWLLTESFAWLGAIALADALAVMVFLPVAGALTDRMNRLTLARLSQLALMLVGVLFAVLTFLDLITIWGLFGLMLLLGVAEAFWTPVRMSMAANLVPRDDLTSAIGLGSVSYNLAQLFGPALAGVILTFFAAEQMTGIAILFTLNVLSFAGYFIVLFMIKLREQEHLSNPQNSILTDLKEGVRYVIAKRGLGLFMMLMVATTLITRSYRELLAGIADGVFAQGPSGLGISFAGVGIGAIIGSLLVANSKNVDGLMRWVLLSFALSVLLQFAFALTQNFWLAVVSLTGLSCAASFGGISSQVLVQSSIHGVMRGRVMSLWSMILRGGPATGAWIIGAIAGFWDLQLVIAMATALYLAILLLIWPRRQYLADTMESAPDESNLPDLRRSQ